MKSDVETRPLATGGARFMEREGLPQNRRCPPVPHAPPRGSAKGKPHLHVQDRPRVAHCAGVAHRQGVVAALQLKLLEGELDDLRGGKESDSASSGHRGWRGGRRGPPRAPRGVERALLPNSSSASDFGLPCEGAV